MVKIIHFIKDDGGTTAIEYTLIAAGIAIAITAGVFMIGDRLEIIFGGVSTNLEKR